MKYLMTWLLHSNDQINSTVSLPLSVVGLEMME